MTEPAAAGLCDTSVFIAQESGRRLDEAALPMRWALSVVTIGELRAGVLAASDLATRDRRLSTLTLALSLEPVPVDDAVAQAWARLRLDLLSAGRRMPVNDSWIAATAVALGVPLVTQDEEMRGLPGVDVLLV